MENDELALIWFDYNDISFLRAEKFLKKFDKIEHIFDTNLVKNAFFEEAELNSISQKLLTVNKFKFQKQVEEEFYKYNITPVTFCSSNYPEKLKNIDNPPLVLYARGDVSLLSKKSIAIVGTRKPTDYGRLVCEKFTKTLSGAGLVTVSGLAYGIDTVVARASLDAGGKTIAVLAGGLDSIYPAQNAGLAEKIENNGLLLSEQRPKLKPMGYMFVNRNRIVSGLSLGTLIVEAGKRSGTITTAHFAIEQGRELFVVPGNITSAESEGTNNLIDEMPDTFTISPERILLRLKIKPRQKNESAVQVDILQTKILNCLSAAEKSFDELLLVCSVKPSELASELIKLEMLGLVKKGSNGQYFKI